MSRLEAFCTHLHPHPFLFLFLSYGFWISIFWEMMYEQLGDPQLQLTPIPLDISYLCSIRIIFCVDMQQLEKIQNMYTREMFLKLVIIFQHKLSIFDMLIFSTFDFYQNGIPAHSLQFQKMFILFQRTCYQRHKTFADVTKSKNVTNFENCHE